VNGDCLWPCGAVCHSPPSISAPRSHGKLRSTVCSQGDCRRVKSSFCVSPGAALSDPPTQRDSKKSRALRSFCVNERTKGYRTLTGAPTSKRGAPFGFGTDELQQPAQLRFVSEGHEEARSHVAFRPVRHEQTPARAHRFSSPSQFSTLVANCSLSAAALAACRTDALVSSSFEVIASAKASSADGSRRPSASNAARRTLKSG
jgi:hypothetical protein